MSDSWRNELITKGAAFDALTEVESHYEFEDGHDHLMRWAKTKIFALPSAQPHGIARDIATIIENEKDMRVMLQQRWIPCDDTVEIPDHEVLACDKYGEEILGYLGYADDQWICESDSEVMYDPIAWMEKPEPYKGDQ